MLQSDLKLSVAVENFFVYEFDHSRFLLRKHFYHEIKFLDWVNLA
jgi:hypothetical protein